MRDYNVILASLTCPHCGVQNALEVACWFGAVGEAEALKLHDPYPWVPRKAVWNGGSPADGEGVFDGQAECPACDLDFCVDVDIRDNRIAALAPNRTAGFKTGAPPQGVIYYRPGELDPALESNDYGGRVHASEQLAAMCEPSLLQPVEGFDEICRFLWMPTFDPSIAVRVGRRPDGSVLLHCTELDGAGGYEPGSVASATERELASSAWEQLLAQLQKIPFWDVPVPDDAPLSDVVREVLDGEIWILEGLRGEVRIVVREHSPEPGPLRDTGLMFLELAGRREVLERVDAPTADG